MNESFDKLLEQFLEDHLKPGSVTAFLSEAERDVNEEMIKEKISQRLVLAGGLSKGVNLERKFEEMMAIARDNDQGTRSRENVYLINWRRWVAVAAVLVISLGIWFFKSREDGETESPKMETIADVSAPDRTRAMIMLADGRTISLDSLTTLTQGDVQISKTSDGKLIYKPSQLTPRTSQLQYNTLYNPRGSKVIDMQLSDGSHVWLNAGSSITYPIAFIGEERKVSMTGEAYFEVASRESVVGSRKTPFIVEKAGMQVTVLGTKFNVNAYDDESEIRVTLLEGSVKVSRTNSTSNIQNSTLLKPGQQAALTPHASSLTINSGVDLQQVLAWKNGRFEFSGLSVQEIMRQVSRWYDVEIVYDGAVPKEDFMGGTSRQGNISALLKVLEATNKIHFKIERRKVVVMK